MLARIFLKTRCEASDRQHLLPTFLAINSSHSLLPSLPHNASMTTIPPPVLKNMTDVQHVLEHGHTAYRSGDYPTAYDAFAHALGLLDLGNAAARLGRDKEARKHLEESIALKRAYYGEEDDEVIGVGIKNMDMARSLEELALVCMRLPDYHEAKRAYHEALDIKRIVHGRDYHQAGPQHGTMKQQEYGYDRALNSDIAYTVNKLGEIAHKLGRYHNARKHYAEALEMYKASYGGPTAKHIHIASVLANLGQVNADIGKARYAKAYLDQALTMALETLGEDSPDHPVLQTIRSRIDALASQE